MSAKRLFIFAGTTAVAVAAVVAAIVLAPWSSAQPAPFLPSETVAEPLPQAASVEVRYIANEGVLISLRDKRVLVDGLHRKYEDAYAYLPDAEREKIESAKPPLDRVDLVLVSHNHRDHFHPDSIGLYLKNSPKTLLASSQQVVDGTAAKFADYALIKERMTPIAYQLKSRRPMHLAGIDVEFLGVGHGSGRHAAIQNLGHVISLGGKKILHVGDSEIAPEIYDGWDLETNGIDIAVLPYWLLTAKTGRELIETLIKPKHIIATHVGPGESESITKEVKKHFPNADVFTTLLERRKF
jgi:L-ascorbate metabolism protein UlaG (beta-lactamase superfamily)